jgi:hypothetical protein
MKMKPGDADDGKTIQKQVHLSHFNSFQRLARCRPKWAAACERLSVPRDATSRCSEWNVSMVFDQARKAEDLPLSVGGEVLEYNLLT